MRLVEALISALMVAGLYATMSYGLALIYGVRKIINLANAGTMMLGAFVTLLIWQATGLDPLLCVFIVGPLFFGLGAVTEVFLVRRVAAQAPIISLLLLFGGGLVSVVGVGFASVVLALAENLTVTLWKAQLENLVSFVLLVVVLVVMPGGLAALLRRRGVA